MPNSTDDDEMDKLAKSLDGLNVDDLGLEDKFEDQGNWPSRFYRVLDHEKRNVNGQLKRLPLEGNFRKILEAYVEAYAEVVGVEIGDNGFLANGTLDPLGDGWVTATIKQDANAKIVREKDYRIGDSGHQYHTGTSSIWKYDDGTVKFAIDLSHPEEQ